MLAQRLHAYEFITMLAQHWPNMLNESRATLHLHDFPMLGQQSVFHSVDIGPSKVCMLSGLFEQSYKCSSPKDSLYKAWIKLI